MGRDLAVQAPHHPPLAREAVVVLHELARDPGGLEPCLAPDLGEEAALVAEPIRRDQHHLRYRQMLQLQGWTPSANSSSSRPSSVLLKLLAAVRSPAASMKPIRNATSSGQPTSMPCRDWMVCTKGAACSRLSGMPAWSQAQPRRSRSTCSVPSSRYIWFSSVISSSPRADGLTRRASWVTRSS